MRLMQKFSPCYKCTKRTPMGECHSTCKEYKEYDLDNRIRRISRYADGSYVDYITDTVTKKKRRKNERHSNE